MLQQLLRYDTEQAGMLMMPRGIATMVAMMVAGPLTSRIDARYVMGAGLLSIVIGQFVMSGFDVMMDARPVIIAGMLQGAGIGLVAIPMMVVGFSSLPPALRTDAAAVFSLLRNVSGSIGIAICTALVARNLQVSHSELGGHVTMQSMPFLDDRLIQQLGRAGGTVAALVDAEVNRQALMIAYVNDFWMMMWGAVIISPMVLLLRPVRGHVEGPPILE
jgi:DHA2 family multidrug resistance protein